MFYFHLFRAGDSIIFIVSRSRCVPINIILSNVHAFIKQLAYTDTVVALLPELFGTSYMFLLSPLKMKNNLRIIVIYIYLGFFSSPFRGDLFTSAKDLNKRDK